MKGRKHKHYTLQILLDVESPELGKKLPAAKENVALPPADETRPDLAGPVATEEELVAEEASSASGAPPTGDEISVVATPVKQIYLRNQRDAQGKPFKEWRIVTEAGHYFTCDEALKNIAQTAMKNVEFVEIGFRSGSPGRKPDQVPSEAYGR